MNKYYIPLAIFIFFVFAFSVSFVVLRMQNGLPLPYYQNTQNPGEYFPKEPSGITIIKKDITQFKRFASEDELKLYLDKAQFSESVYDFGSGLERAITLNTAISVAGKFSDGAVAPQPARVSETNVQVLGIDEPDIVKTDGKNIFLSSENFYRGIIRPMPFAEPAVLDSIAPGEFYPRYKTPETKVVNAFPPEDLKEISSIENSGNMLFFDKVLVIFSGNVIYGYDVTDPKNPKEKWTVNLENGTQLTQARLYKDKIYLITNNSLNKYKPCPIVPFMVDDRQVTVPCGGIYHPEVVVPVNTTYSISTINPKTGDLTLGISFLGSYNSTIYMSENSIYVGYAYSGDLIEFFYGFVTENTDLFSSRLLDRLSKLRSYDISQNSKFNEMRLILDEFNRSLDKDDALTLQNEMQNRMTAYLTKHKRDLEKTDIVKVGLENLDVKSLGTVPGRLINQFSLDEYQDNLRVAVTVGQQGFWQFGFGRAQTSVNDVYVLDKDMNVISSVTDLAPGERIYSVRFLEDKGYVVTFKQIDPFFVLDLKDPKNPKLEGELKIPGYSSYLHPITKDKIVGVGKENAKVKLSLFDVSDPKNPKEVSKYTLDEYWSDVLNTHRAFLMDKKNKIFFIPGGKGGYIFSYENDELRLKKAISGVQAKRAVYIDDYLYVIGTDKIVVVSESTWERVSELKL